MNKFSLLALLTIVNIDAPLPYNLPTDSQYQYIADHRGSALQHYATDLRQNDATGFFNYLGQGGICRESIVRNALVLDQVAAHHRLAQQQGQQAGNFAPLIQQAPASQQAYLQAVNRAGNVAKHVHNG